MHYALSRAFDDGPYHVYGKGDDPAAAEEDAARNIADDIDEAHALRRGLIVLTREASEQRGIVAPGAPVIWHDDLRRYRVEDHGRYRPLRIEHRIRRIMR